MLARSSSSEESDLSSVVGRTKAVIFLGTPHRGSLDFVAAANWAQSLLRSLGMETTTTIINALGLRTTDLERAQEAFSSLWHRYNFRGKTFQKRLGLTGINVGILGDIVVPDCSSLLGDERERAETIQANHREMCRFSGHSDPNYCKVSSELRSICNSIKRERHTIPKTPQENQSSSPQSPPIETINTPGSAKSRRMSNHTLSEFRCSNNKNFTEVEKICLGVTAFHRYGHSPEGREGTCWGPPRCCILLQCKGQRSRTLDNGRLSFAFASALVSGQRVLVQGCHTS